MKIVHVCDYVQPTMGYQDTFLPRAHAKAGHDVTIISSDRYYPFPDYEHTVGPLLGERYVGPGIEERDGYRIVRLSAPWEWHTKIWLKGLGEAIARASPDLVISHGIVTPTALRVAGIKSRMGFRLIYDDHTLICNAREGLIGWLLYNVFPFGKILNAADRLIGISPGCVDVMVQKYRFPRERVEMVPLGADTEMFCPDEGGRRAFREAYAIEEDKVVCLHTGKLYAGSGPHNICDAVGTLEKAVARRLVLLFVGNLAEEYRQHFTTAVEAVRSKCRIIHIPAVPNEQLPRIYAAADFAVWPEPSISTIDAASSGLAIICSDYLIERYSEGNGIPVKEGDVPGLAGAILAMVERPEERVRMGQRGRAYVERELSWKVIAERFLA